MSSNQLIVMIVENIPEEKESEVTKISEIPEETFELENVYYLYVYVMIWFKNEVSVDYTEYQTDV